ncbi:MAG: fatty acyl-AMP ligase [Gammaproteobacteria bacterium]|nr:fatty acyl-AMP ligase [Gammaproteobacteria bacterium]MDH5344384.1 fatty acyl-AMP ligase [Gammaproteobacteria bacterium]
MKTRRKERALAQVLERRANGGAEREALIYRQGDNVRDIVTGADLMERAQRAAAGIRAAGAMKGDRVMLMLTSQSDFVDAFLGAVWADTVPVPLFPPLFSRRPDDFIANFANIAAGSGARLLIASDDISRAALEFSSRLAGAIHVLARSAWGESGERLMEAPQRCGNDLALLQYTSGSTGMPKGVALSHTNLVTNMEAIGRAVNLSMDDTGVSWLPLYHDMGLIGVLSTLYRGGRVVVLSPLEFAKDPASWLRAISDHRGTLSPAPNFAYERCLRLDADDIADIDLSSWRVAFNGAEPVRADTVRRFTARFGAAGFRSTAFYPVYGLAEHTLAVSFPRLGEGPRFDTVDRGELTGSGVAIPSSGNDAVSFVSVGRPLDGVSVEIRDERGATLNEGRVGEITVQSDSVMTGYFGNPAASADVLDSGWLKTGDLGYFRNGLLYVTGRIKDVIIRAGRNYYPDDIERAINGLDGVRAGRAAAFSVPADAGREDVVVVVETTAECELHSARLIKLISSAIAARVGFVPERIDLHARDTLPLTSSGKVRRSVVRERFLAGTL